MTASRRVAAACLVCFLVSLSPRLVWAGPPSAAKQVDKGVQMYMGGHYEEAVDLLQNALQSKNLDPQRRIGAFQYLAFSQVALGDLDAAELTFKNLLREKPDYQIPAGTSPKIVAVFDKTRPAGAPPTPKPTAIFHQAPAMGQLGRSLTIEAEAKRLPAGAGLVVKYRYSEGSRYTVQRMNAKPDGRFTANLPSPMDTKHPLVTYFIEALGSSGEVLAASGEATAPWEVPFDVPAEKKPEEGSSSTWWIWALVGAAAAGGALALALTLSGSGEQTGRAIVTIEVVE